MGAGSHTAGDGLMAFANVAWIGVFGCGVH